MSRTSGERRKTQRNTVVSALSARRRREVLRVLVDRESTVAERELASRLAAPEREPPAGGAIREAEGESSAGDASREEVRSVHVQLRHRHLPKLADANLVEWDREEATVTTTEHPALRAPQFRRMIETEAPEWDAVVGNLADARRALVLSVLADEAAAVSREELASAVAALEVDGGSRPDEEELLASLHHVHLPALADAGLVEYDADDGTVTYEGHPDLDEAWLVSRPGATSSLPAD